MGYMRIDQYADIVEVRDYEKNYIPHRIHHVSKALKKRRKNKDNVQRFRSPFSIRRARNKFFHLVAENLYRRGNPCIITLTYYRADISINEGYSSILSFKRNVKNQMGETLTYIAVPEKQKSGRLHFHLLAWGIDKSRAVTERSTRNLQRQFGKGYLDVRFAYDSSPKLAGYLSKYFSKSYGSNDTTWKRAYSCSRDVYKPRYAGSNTLSSYGDLIPDVQYLQEVTSYDTMYFGKCQLTKYKIKI